MDETGHIKNRKVIPRWRPLERTNLHELVSASTDAPYRTPTDELLRFYYYKWQNNPTIENALDVISYAQTSGYFDLRIRSSITPLRVIFAVVPLM